MIRKRLPREAFSHKLVFERKIMSTKEQQKSETEDSSTKLPNRIDYVFTVDEALFNKVEEEVLFLKRNVNYSESKQSLIYEITKKYVDELELTLQKENPFETSLPKLRKIKVMLDERLQERIKRIRSFLKKTKTNLSTKDIIIQAIEKYFKTKKK